MEPCALIASLALILMAPAAPAGLGRPSLAPDPKVVMFEDALISAINKQREQKKLPPLVHDLRARGFMRREAELGAKGDPSAASVGERIKQQNLAPLGHYLHFGFGTQADKTLKELMKDKAAAAALLGDWGKIGVGGFWVPVEPPYVQFGLLLIRDLDANAGKPGLSTTETDPVIRAAMPRVTRCYDTALASDPNVTGDTIFQLVIGGDGKVTGVTALKGIGQLAFDTCVSGVLRSLVFPTPYKNKPVTLNHPMRFVPPQGTERRLGLLAKSQVSAAFGRFTKEYRACYDAFLQRRPRTSASVSLSVTVLPDGGHRDFRVAAVDAGDEVLGDCVLGVAKQVRFPRPEHHGEVDLLYPLRFDP